MRISPRDPRIVGMVDGIGRGSDELALRYLDSDWPDVHSFEAGVLLPQACVRCGDEAHAPWHRMVAS